MGQSGWTFIDPSERKSIPSQNGAESGVKGAQSDGPNELLREIQKDGIPCFGGRLLRHKDSYGNPYVSFMAPARKSEEDGPYYARFYAMQTRFLVPFREIRVGQYRLFTYALNDAEEESVRDRLRKGPLDGLQILKSLTRILQEYADAQSEYYPLQAISPDTVFINRRNDIRILPLRAWESGNFPVELRTDDAGSSRADVKTDLYSAVYLAMEICSGSFDGVPQMPPSEVLTYALLPHALRPELEEVSAILGNRLEREPMRGEPARPERSAKKDSLWTRFRLWVRDIFEPSRDIEATYTKSDVQRPRRSTLGMFSAWIRRRLAPDRPDEGDGTFQKGL